MYCPLRCSLRLLCQPAHYRQRLTCVFIYTIVPGMSSIALSSRQEFLLRYLETFLTERGYAPTLSEMASALGASSLQAAKNHLVALERKGYLRRSPGRRRAIELLAGRPLEATGIPILGRVSAGLPLLAVENREGSLPLNPLRTDHGTYFALHVKGDSMIDAGIFSGDYVIVRQQDTADPGDIVVALLGDETTVKILRRGEQHFVLEAANPAYAPIELADYPAPRILGRVMGLYRRLGPWGQHISKERGQPQSQQSRVRPRARS
jgi:repressor LexA